MKPLNIHSRFKIVLITVITIVILLPTGAFSQKYAIHEYSEDGFPDLGTVTTIFQDSRGIMWFGGSRGVAYYDGRTFHRFSTVSGLVDNFTYTIKESKDNKIWICTYHGINIYDPVIDSLSYFPTDPGPAIRDLEFSDNFILFATSGSAYSIPLNRNKGHYDILQDIQDNGEPYLAPVNDLNYDKETGTLWIASSKVGVLKINLTQYAKLWEMKDNSLQDEYQTVGHNKFHEIHPELIDRSITLSNMELKLSLFTISDPDERRKIIEANTRVYSINGIDKDWFVNKICIDLSGNVFAYSRENVYQLIGNKFVLINGFNHLAGKLNWFDIDSKGHFLFAGENGAFEITFNDTLKLNSETGLANRPVTSLYHDDQEILWVTTQNGSLHKIIDRSIQIYDAETDGALKELKSVIKLKDGSILLGGEFGLTLFKDGQVVPFHFQPPSGDPFIGFAFDKNQNLIISTTTRIYLIRGREVTLLAKNLNIVHNEVKFQLDSEDVLWIVMGMKVFTWDGNSLKPQKQLEKHIYLCTYIYLGEDNEMFFGTWRGLYKLKGDYLWLYTFGYTLKHDLKHPELEYEVIQKRGESKILDDVVTCGGVGLDSAYWFGTFGGGLLRFRNDSMKSYCLDDSVASRHINNSHVDSKNNIYFLGDEGVTQVTSEGIEPIHPDSQINANFFDMTIDSNDRKLYATSDGLVIATPMKQLVINKSYGLENDEILKITTIEANRYLLLQKHGFVTVDIDRLTGGNPQSPPLTINKFIAGDEIIRLDNPVSLSPNQRNITFQFSLNDFVDESKNSYSWKLEGLDDNFTKFSSAQEATYQRLPAGSYRFHLKAMNSKCIVTLKDSPVEFEIQTHYYESTLFHIILIVIGAFVIYLFIRFRIRQVQKRNLLLEHTVRHRTKDLEEALNNIKTLKGMIPICANCKKIRDDGGFWQQVEEYIAEHSEANFSHGICPDCVKELYPEIYDRIKKERGYE